MPELQATISEKGAIPAGMETFYIEKDGVFTLAVEGMKTQKDFDNYAEALKKRFVDSAADFSKGGNAGVTREELLDTVESALKKFAPSKPNGDGKGEDQESGDVSARLHDLERNLASLTESNAKLIQERDEALGNSRGTTIRNSLNTAAQAAGATPEGINNLVTLVEQNFELTQDGTVVTKLEAKDGVSPNQKPEDFFAAAARLKQYRMFWPASKGANADGDGPGGPGGGADNGSGNPWSKSGWNMTKQGQLYRSNKAEAERLMAAVGVKLGATAPVR